MKQTINHSLNNPVDKSRPIMIMAGGTGGHVFPALAIADYLHKKNVPLLWLGSKKGLENKLVPAAGYRLLTMSISGVRGKGGLTIMLAPFRILFAILQAIYMMISHRPVAVLGMGGFASGPGGVAAWLMRIPLLIHEQNAIAGMTNRWLSRLATRVFEAFPGSLPADRSASHVGNPVRDSIIELNKGKEKEDGPRILIVGGSLGAVKLNQVVPVAISQLSKNVQKTVKIWHQTGSKDFDQTLERYETLDIEAKVEPFLDEIEKAYAWANMVICRAGALTVSELAVAGLPAILVPYPYAVDDHQTANGRYLADVGAAVLIKDHELEPQSLAEILESWINTPGLIGKMARKARTMALTNATEQVAEACYELAYGGAQ